MPGHDLIVIGASAGGVQALSEVARNLPKDLPAAVLTVLHTGPGKSALPEILGRAGELPACHPENGEKILPGRIYAAPPDCHMVVDDSSVRLVRGPKENGHRPAIDVLFRSAARAYGPRVVGVVLTGNLDDGTAGLLAIKKLGGLAVVQDPEDADYPSMPQSALESVPVDHVVSLAELTPLLVRLAHDPVPEDPPAPDKEMDVSDEEVGQSGQEMDSAPSGFTCPDCGGALWEWTDEPLVRFRCRTGHAYSPESLVSAQLDAVEEALWAAVRSLQEEEDLTRRLAQRLKERGSRHTARRFSGRAEAAKKNADTLREVLTRFPANTE